jgi:hypothetical protein
VEPDTNEAVVQVSHDSAPPEPRPAQSDDDAPEHEAPDHDPTELGAPEHGESESSGALDELAEDEPAEAGPADNDGETQVLPVVRLGEELDERTRLQDLYDVPAEDLPDVPADDLPEDPPGTGGSTRAGRSQGD